MTETIDYRALLVCYMAVVIEAEGASFIPGNTGLPISDEEIATLRQIEIEACFAVTQAYPEDES